jgi:chromosome segregation ATPase
MSYENRPRKLNELNQRNLNHLNDEVDNYLDEEVNENENEKQSVVEDNIDLKQYLEELNKKLIDKDDIIQNQSFQLQTLNQMVDNLKKNTKNLNEKLADYEKLKIHINAQNKKMADMEKETEVIKQEYMYY